MNKTVKFATMALAAALCAVLAVSLTACGSSSSSNSSSGSSGSSNASSSSSSSGSSSASGSDTSSSGSSDSGSSDSGSSAAATSEPAYKDSASGKYAKGIHHAKVTIDGFDPFTIELDADSAPVTVANFCELAEDGFYEGTGFHRIIDKFCFQGGDPTGTGAGGADEEILGEFSANGVDNPLADDFKKGTVAMARSTLPNSASSQFFVTLASDDNVSLSLNGNYAAFGTIDKAGMKIVDAIVKKYLPAAEAGGGVIADKADMPTIKSVKITD